MGFSIRYLHFFAIMQLVLKIPIPIYFAYVHVSFAYIILHIILHIILNIIVHLFCIFGYLRYYYACDFVCFLPLFCIL